MIDEDKQIYNRLHELGRPRVCIIGDIFNDIDAHCRSDRRDPADPRAPVYSIIRRDCRPGGAGAVANMVEALGGQPMLQSFRSDNGLVETKTRIFVDGQFVARVDDSIPCEVRINFNDIAAADAVLICDHGKGAIDDKSFAQVAHMCSLSKIPLIVDPAPNAYWAKYLGATLVKCNQHEDATAHRGGWDFRCIDGTGNDAQVLVTCGQHGAILHPAYGVDGNPVGFAAMRVEQKQVVDSTGCGDVVLAMLGVGLGAGLELRDCIHLGMIAAGLKVQRRGAVPVSRTEILGRLDGTHRKIIPDGHSLQTWADRWRADGKRVVLTNGCFDCLHAGHLHLLKEARKMGDVLVVAVNDDESVRALKGYFRPRDSQHHRAANLAALGYVDKVVVFGGPMPTHIAKVVKPAVLVKGSDYIGKTIAGSEHAGRIEYVQRIEEHSTTRILAGSKV